MRAQIVAVSSQFVPESPKKQVDNNSGDHDGDC
jgi:hypothetical protein